MRTYEIETRTTTCQPTAVERATLAVGDLPHWLGHAFATVAGYLANQHAGPAGPPFARFHRHGDGTFDVEAGFPSVIAVPGAGEVHASTLPGGVVAATWHVGRYDEMAPAYHAVAAYVAERGVPNGDPWEVYCSDPMAEPDPTHWRTEVVQPFTPRAPRGQESGRPA